MLMAASGHSSIASSQQSASSHAFGSMTWLRPSSCTSNTSGQMSSQMPQPVQRSGSTLGVAILFLLLGLTNAHIVRVLLDGAQVDEANLRLKGLPRRDS